MDIKTGALALSCAMNAVIVGDDKQLPNVVSREEAQALDAILSTYNVEDVYKRQGMLGPLKSYVSPMTLTTRRMMISLTMRVPSA